MNGRRRRREPPAGGSSARYSTAGTPHRSAARAELQRLFAPPSESFAVVAVRDDGRRVLYEHYDDRIAADAMVAALSRIKLRAEIVTGIARSVRPGTTIRPTS